MSKNSYLFSMFIFSEYTNIRIVHTDIYIPIPIPILISISLSISISISISIPIHIRILIHIHIHIHTRSHCWCVFSRQPRYPYIMTRATPLKRYGTWTTSNTPWHFPNWGQWIRDTRLESSVHWVSLVTVLLIFHVGRLCTVVVVASPGRIITCELSPWNIYMKYSPPALPLSISLFSSAADIISGAYPVPSRPSSVSLSVRPSTFFSDRIGSLSFHPFLPIFGLNVHSNIATKVVKVEFWVFASNVFNGSLITKICNKWEF